MLAEEYRKYVVLLCTICMFSMRTAMCMHSYQCRYVPENLVQLLDHVLLLVGVVYVKVEHLAERLRVLEHRRQQEVQQRPQLVQVVLTPSRNERVGGGPRRTNGQSTNRRRGIQSRQTDRQHQ